MTLAGMLLCMAVAAAGGAPDAESRILQLDAEWAKAAESRDVERVLSFWADDAVVFPPGGPSISGKAAIRQFVVKSFETPGFRISWKSTNVTVARAGDLAYATGSNRVTFNGPDGKPVSVDGKAVTVWRREKDGGWKCVIDIWNDTSPPAP